MPDLFSPYTLKGVTLRNRIAMSPMTMYSSVEGRRDDYHVSYLGAHAAGGNPHRGIPAICWTLKPDDGRPFSLFDLSDRLRVRGWQVAAYTLPPDLQETAVMRALVRHGFTRDMADRLLDDVRDALGWFGKHPMQRPSGADEGSSDPHGGVHPKTDAT